MKRGMTSREWEELKALGRMERLGDERRDYVVAVAGFVAARAMGSKVELEDMLAVKEGHERTPEQMANLLDGLANGSQHSNPGN